MLPYLHVALYLAALTAFAWSSVFTSRHLATHGESLDCRRKARACSAVGAVLLVAFAVLKASGL